MPPIDQLALWIVTLGNSFAIVLLVRQFALTAHTPHTPTVRRGPQVGSALGDWRLMTLQGTLMPSAEAARAYTLLFVSSTCEPCHTLFSRLRERGRPDGTIYVVAQGDPLAVDQESRTAEGPLHDRLLLGATGDLYQRLEIPGTPFAVAVASGTVTAAGPAIDPDQLASIVTTARAPAQSLDA